MTLASVSLTAIGLTLLVHAIYSQHEHSVLAPSSSVPIDITLETLISTSLLLLAVVLSAAPLRPIRWRAWAGRIEREGWNPGAADTEDAVLTRGRANPYRALEERKGFWDVRGARREFAEWVRSES